MTVEVEAMEVRDGIAIVSICDVITALGLWDEDYDTWPEAVDAWCASKGAAQYSAGREDFWVGHAVALAKREGRSMVVVEDLS